MRISFTTVGLIAGLMLAQSASAADMAVKAPPPPPAACIWCGFYIGADGGGDWARQSGVTNPFPSGFGAPAIIGAGFAGIGVLPTSHLLIAMGGWAAFTPDITGKSPTGCLALKAIGCGPI